MLAKLFTRDRQFVADIELPRFNPPSDGIIWGERFFVFDQMGGFDEPLLYTEGMLFHLPAGMPPAGVTDQPTHEIRG